MSKKKSILSRILSWSIRICVMFMIASVVFIVFINVINGKGDFQRSIIEGVLAQATGSEVKIGTLEGAYFFPDFILKASNIKGINPETKELEWVAGKIEVRSTMRSLMGGTDKYKFLNIEKIYISSKLTSGKNLDIEKISLIPKTVDKGVLEMTGKWGEDYLSASLTMDFVDHETRPDYFVVGDKTPYNIRYRDIVISGEIDPLNENGEFSDISISLMPEADLVKQSSDLDLFSYKEIAKANMDIGMGWNSLKAAFKMDGFSSSISYESIFEEIKEKIFKEKIAIDLTVEEIDLSKLSEENSDLSKLYKSISHALKAQNSEESSEPSIISIPKTETNLNINIDKVILDGKDIANISIPVEINNGTLIIDSITGKLAGGNIKGGLKLLPAETKDTMIYNFSSDLNINKMNFGKLQENIKSDADLKISLNGSGETWGNIHKSLNGNFSFIVANGELSSSLIDMWGGGLVKALVPDLTGEGSKLNCVISNFEIEDAAAKSQALLIDTEKVTVKGEGTINLLNGDIKFTIEPDAKKTSLLDLATAMNITGNIRDPKISPDLKSVGKKGISALFGLINPALLLVTMTDFGVNEDHPCHKFMDKE